MEADHSPLLVVLTEQALADLSQIGATIRKDSPRRAATFIAELYGCCQQLGETPRAFSLLPGWKERGIRKRPHGSYLIFYRVGRHGVEVLHVLHGARDYEAILSSEAQKP